MLRLAAANMLHRKLRSAICIAAVGVGIAMLLVLVGMTEGSLGEVAARMRSVGADLLVHPDDVNPVLDSEAIMPMKAGEMIEAVDGVRAACPVVLARIALKNKTQRVFGVNPDAFRSVGASLEIVEGRLWQGENEIVIDRRLSEGLGYKLNDVINRLGRDLTVVGICEANNGARVLMPIETLQKARAVKDRASFFFVKCASPDDAGTVASKIEQALAVIGVRTILLRDYDHALRQSFRGLEEFIRGVSAVCLAVSFLVIFLALYVAVLERTREIGILKSLGASKAAIVMNVMAESLFLCLLGVLCGIALSTAGKFAIAKFLPMLTVVLSVKWMLAAGALGVAGSVLGAVYPAWCAARLDPAVALNYE
ncbi:MAG: ABC transporter permease [Planctomycetota bacterium]